MRDIALMSGWLDPTLASMTESLPDDLVNYLRELGHALDIKQPVSVYDGGRVGFSDVDDHEVSKNGKRQTAGRPAAGSWERSPRARWPSGGPRASAETHHFRSRAVEEAFGAGFRVLAHHYEALGVEDRNGLWVAVKSYPLGNRGPQIHFLCGLPLDLAITPRAWAFNLIGPKAELVGLRHTNFPDASICAFTASDNAWRSGEGILTLIDHYSTWMIKKLHFEVLGWWPGPQAGACALYRRLESNGREWCGCQSGKRYNQCHQAKDGLMAATTAEAEFFRLFKCDYGDRIVPNCILDAARARWKKLPSLALAFSFRRADEPSIPMGI